MKVVNNEKGFKIAEVSPDEASRLGWGDICDNCNDEMTGNRYFVPVLGRRCLCKGCLDEWLDFAIRFKEDIPYEKREWDTFLMECDYYNVKIECDADN